MLKVILNILILLFIICSVCLAKTPECDFEYQSKGRRDPFIALVTKDGRILPGAREVSETGTIELEGIIWDPQGNSIAIINGKLFKERQRFYDLQVLKIRKASVILQKEGEVMVINLKKGGTDNGHKK